MAKVDRLFGSSGIRGVVGGDFSVDLCHGVARAIGASLPPGSRVCIATDTRLTREVLKEAATSGLIASGIDVVDLGILPTPALAFLTREHAFDTGIMITASHNPPEFNGIKLFNSDCLGYSRAQEEEIERVFAEKAYRDGPSGRLSHEPGLRTQYFRFMEERFSGRMIDPHLRLVVDPGNGAASGFARELFSVLQIDTIAVNDHPDGHFPNRNPEPREDTLTGTVDFLRQENADLAVCFDGDADRVVFCDRDGFLGLSRPIALISRIAVQQSGKTKVATTVETGRLLDWALADVGVQVVRGKVGDVNVAHLSRDCHAAIGVEEIGVYVIPGVGYYPEPFWAVLSLLSGVGSVGEIRSAFAEIPRLFLGKRSLACPNHCKEAVMEMTQRNVDSFRAAEVNTLDGLRLEFDDSWMLIRASGTEPAIRVIAEAVSAARLEMLLKQGVDEVEGNLRNIAR